MGLKLLIKNQTLRIDDHKRVALEANGWDTPNLDVVIDKSTNYILDEKYQKIKIRVPVNFLQPVEIENGSDETIGEIPQTLEEEIKKAFEDKGIRSRFITDLVEILKDFDAILGSEESVREVLEKLSSHFGLEWSKFKATTYTKDILQHYSETYFDDLGTEYFMVVSRFEIKIGQGRLFPFGPLVPKK
jgi:hypothetical protein